MRKENKQHDYFIYLAVAALVIGGIFCFKEKVSAKTNHGPAVDTVYEIVDHTQYCVDVFKSEVMSLDEYVAAGLEFEGTAKSEKRYAKFPLLRFKVPLSGVEISATATGTVIATYDLSNAIIDVEGKVVTVHLPQVELSTKDVEYTYETKDGLFNDPTDEEYASASKAAVLAMIDEARIQHIEETAQKQIENKLQQLARDIAGKDLVVYFA